MDDLQATLYMASKEKTENQIIEPSASYHLPPTFYCVYP